MAEPAKTNKWQRVAAIGTAATAVPVVFGAGAFVVDYFAKADQVSRFQCLTEKRLELLEVRAAANNEYGNYVNNKVKIAALISSSKKKTEPKKGNDKPAQAEVAADPDTEEKTLLAKEVVELAELVGQREKHYAAAEEYRLAAEDLAKRIREGICDATNRRGEAK